MSYNKIISLDRPNKHNLVYVTYITHHRVLGLLIIPAHNSYVAALSQSLS